VESPGLLGQLMLATVAIQAARNSRKGDTTGLYGGFCIEGFICLLATSLGFGLGISSLGGVTGALGFAELVWVISSTVVVL
jgi:hypothetical protein